MLIKEEFSSNLRFPIDVTEDGISMLLIKKQLEKASSPIDSKELGKSILVNEEQLLKA